jgi:DNA-binding transcriptional regulator GbsR (MarR family)
MSGREIPEEVQAAREEVIEAAARSAEVYGLNGSYGRLYAILYFAEEPLSLDDLADRSGYAKSTVSTAMQAMERLHFIKRRSIPGEGKRLYFEAETDAWRIAQQILNQEVRREFRTMTQALDAAEEHLDGVEHPQAEADLEKIRFLERQYSEWETILDVLTSTTLERLEELFSSLRNRD